MDISELLNYRLELLESSKDSDGFISESDFLQEAINSMRDTNLVDSEDFTACYYNVESEKIKINGYRLNDSEERLQLFIVNEDSITLNKPSDELLISQKSIYEGLFTKLVKFLTKSTNRQFKDELQHSNPIRGLIEHISSPFNGLYQIDVVELFVVSATATVERSGNERATAGLDFQDETLSVQTTDSTGEKTSKRIKIFKRLIDLNFLFNNILNEGKREPLEVNFEKLTGSGIEAIKAADESNFESYLCVLPGHIIADLYQRFSTRLLERNVRSFLQFKGVNKGMKDTIKSNPSQFIAFNNGLTITATAAEVENVNNKTVILSLNDFQIVNGGQTTATIYFSQKDRLDISKVRVMAKINIVKNEGEDELNELITNISKYSNAQSKVTNADLRSRNDELIKLKNSSETIISPSGKKWYFERFKGEFNTLLRKSPKNKTRINNEFPKERRFTKEELAKYYMSWGPSPYLVKKGGDKIFRTFIEEISVAKGNTTNANRYFYEETISKIILFKCLEKIYGSGKNSMGQLRSAVVPYTIGILYSYSCDTLKDREFDLLKIWKYEDITPNLKNTLTNLMELVNRLIKKLSISEDYGENAKRRELWESMIKSKEVSEFLNSQQFQLSLKDYVISANQAAIKRKKTDELKYIDFTKIVENSKIFARTSKYYKDLRNNILETLDLNEIENLDRIIFSIDNLTDIDEETIKIENELIKNTRIDAAWIFDQIDSKVNPAWSKATDFIIYLYNHCVENGLDPIIEFKKQQQIAVTNGVKFNNGFDDVLNNLSRGLAPTISQIQKIVDIELDSIEN